MKTIRYHRLSQYGNTREFINPENAGDARIIQRLTGKKTIDSVTRELLRDLCAGHIQFEETIAPATT